MNRRSVLVAGALLPSIRSLTAHAEVTDAEKADDVLRIANGLAELAPEHIVSTTLYNVQFPGLLLRFKEGQRAVVEVHTDTDVGVRPLARPMIPSNAEEGTRFVEPHGMKRFACVPKPVGFRAGWASSSSTQALALPGKPQWTKPKPYKWDCTVYDKPGGSPAKPDETMEITIIKRNGALNGFNQWTPNWRHSRWRR